MCAAMTFGLGQELWAKMPLESGYSESSMAEGAPSARPAPAVPAEAVPAVTEQSFLEAALAKGLSTHSAEALLKVINGNYANGIKTLGMKDDAWVAEQNAKNEPAEKPQAATRAKKTTKPDPSEY